MCTHKCFSSFHFCLVEVYVCVCTPMCVHVHMCVGPEVNLVCCSLMTVYLDV